MQVFGLSPSAVTRHCAIDGFAKMSVRAHIFASWYNDIGDKEFRPVTLSIISSARYKLFKCLRESQVADKNGIIKHISRAVVKQAVCVLFYILNTF